MSNNMITEINKGKATFTGRSPRHKPATTAGHLEGSEPKPGEDTGATKVTSEMLRCWNKRDKGERKKGRIGQVAYVSPKALGV
jgi:hypothetical protein